LTEQISAFRIQLKLALTDAHTSISANFLNVIFLGESWYFWEKMSRFWLKNGICGRKLQLLAENGMFLGENWYLWWKMLYFCDKTVTCWRKYHIFGEKTAISES